LARVPNSSFYPSLPGGNIARALRTPLDGPRLCWSICINVWNRVIPRLFQSKLAGFCDLGARFCTALDERGSVVDNPQRR
jgi:hypothetical protein